MLSDTEDAKMSHGEKDGTAPRPRRKKDISKETPEEARQAATCHLTVPLSKLFAGTYKLSRVGGWVLLHS